MAITIDQFLHDLTERQLLSEEEAQAVRRRMASPLAEHAGSQPAEEGARPQTASSTVAHPPRLILCDAVVEGKLSADENALVFSAKRLSDKSPVTIHVLVPTQKIDPSASRVNGAASHPKDVALRPAGIVDVNRHGEMLCVSCQFLNGETLEQVVSQNGALPLELATETLLQTARTLKRLEAQGLPLGEVSPQLLLLDEEGRIHLMDQHLSRQSRAEGCQCGGEASPQKLHQSLGRLYAYLQTAKLSPADSADLAWPAHGELSRSAKVVFSRLMGEGGSLYPGWDDLLSDLESMLRGQELSLSAATSTPKGAMPSVKSVEPQERPSAQPQPSMPNGSTALWWVAGLAIALAAAVTAVSFLGE